MRLAEHFIFFATNLINSIMQEHEGNMTLELIKIEFK